jgi:branched-chain amino acid transport system ATP-binding protein
MLVTRGLGKRFGALWAVRHVDLEVAEGDIVGIIGPNGAGKTTLFNVIAGFLRADEGRVELDGRDITGTPAHRVARLGLARTFQIPKPFRQMTVLDNVLFNALPRHRSPARAYPVAREVLEFLDLGAYADQPAAALTVGLLKELELAKALAREPRLLLLDEVMAGLTPVEVKKMMARIETLPARGVTVVWIEHVMAAIMNVARRVVVLHHGERIAEGPPREVARNPVVVQAYLGEEFLLA